MLPASRARWNRREFLRQGGCLLSVAALGKAQTRASAPPNIVLVLADDMGYGDLSSYGCPDIRTPHIDSIGRRGVRFTRFYANAPECTPTRTALLTGRYQQRVGGLECAIGVGNVGRYDEAVWLQQRGELGLPASEPTLAQLLKRGGYETALSGKWHLGYLDKFLPYRHGFDEFFGILGGNADYFTHRELGGNPVLYHNRAPVRREGYLTDLITEHALGWLRGRSRKPFLLYVSYTAPHTPIQGPADSAKSVTEANWEKGDRATYGRMVQRMDDGVGAILEQLDRMGAADNTLVCFLSDNGGTQLSRNAGLRGTKGTTWEGGIRVPLLMRWPRLLAQEVVNSQVAITMDLLPTFLSAAGLRQPSGRRLDGINMLPWLSGKAEPPSRALYWRYKRGQAVRKAVLDGSLKYVQDGETEALHNLAQDEAEKNNLVTGSPAEAARLKSMLAAWEKDVAAPRLQGFRRETG